MNLAKWWKSRRGRPFDDEDPTVLGKIVLVGVTYLDAAGRVTRRGQWWGRILAYNAHDGLRVDLANEGRPHSFPPFPNALRPAKPGHYELKSTGEVVTDPDFLYTLRCHASGNGWTQASDN